MNQDPFTQSAVNDAIADFHTARRKASLREILACLTGQSADLLSYEEVRQKLKSQGGSERGLKQIPLDAIIGSVNRYEDFTRDFLPRASVQGQRWAMVQVATTEQAGVPPIEVYQIGDVYFVKDGNHRVSVARQLKATHIDAYVTEVRTPVPLTADTRPEDLILKAEYAEFLDRIRLHEARPHADLTLTAAGQYAVLEEHILVHQYFMGLDFQRDIGFGEAVVHWYDAVYLPVVWVIRERGLLRDFPGRTEADLYLWIADHRAVLETELGMEIRPEKAADDLAAQFSERRDRWAARLGEKVLDAVLPDTFESGPPTGRWRQEMLAARPEGRLFGDILVPVNGSESGWQALDQAILIARREGARLHGLHVAASREQKSSPLAQSVQAEFERRCADAGLSGKLVLAAGNVVRKICEHSRWHDLTVVNVANPPASQPLARINSGFRGLIQRSPVPILAVSEGARSFERALLAYDGSPKAQEALFLATYLAVQWQVKLSVVTVLADGISPQTLQMAGLYLEMRGVQAELVAESGPPAQAILRVAGQRQSDVILMGGYGVGPLLNVFFDDVVDQILRAWQRPMFICR